MKGHSILLTETQGVETAALYTDGVLSDLFLAPPGPRVGAIYRGVATRPMKGQGGVFVDTPDGPGYLRQIKGVKPGQRLLVQVTGFAEPGKAIPVTTRVLFKSRYCIVTPNAPGLNISRKIRDDDIRDALHMQARAAMDGSEMGLIIRSQAEGADLDAVAEDIEQMRDLAQAVLTDVDGEAELLVDGDGPHALAWREWPEEADVDQTQDAADALGLPEDLDALKSPLVQVGSASLAIEPTRALVAVDVNSGGDTSPAAGLKANLAMARALPRQLRLRGLGGVIVIDPAPMPKKDRRQLEQVLRRALKEDPVETILVGWTELGLLQLQRQRARCPIDLCLA